jgi:hypothetical protein
MVFEMPLYAFIGSKQLGRTDPISRSGHFLAVRRGAVAQEWEPQWIVSVTAACEGAIELTLEFVSTV